MPFIVGDYKLPGWQNCIISQSFFHLICAANEAEFWAVPNAIIIQFV